MKKKLSILSLVMTSLLLAFQLSAQEREPSNSKEPEGQLIGQFESRINQTNVAFFQLADGSIALGVTLPSDKKDPVQYLLKKGASFSDIWKILNPDEELPRELAKNVPSALPVEQIDQLKTDLHPSYIADHWWHYIYKPGTGCSYNSDYYGFWMATLNNFPGSFGDDYEYGYNFEKIYVYSGTKDETYPNNIGDFLVFSHSCAFDDFGKIVRHRVFRRPNWNDEYQAILTWKFHEGYRHYFALYDEWPYHLYKADMTGEVVYLDEVSGGLSIFMDH